MSEQIMNGMRSKRLGKRFPVAGMYPEGALPDEVPGDNEDRIRMALNPEDAAAFGILRVIG